jgi:hypothetical protein
MKIFVRVNRRIVPVGANPIEGYLELEDFKSDRRAKRNLFDDMPLQ